jgi:CubicO group peptidase (beta-lactamase class C family)
MGFIRGTLTGLLGLAFLAAVGNVAYLTLSDQSGSEASAAVAPPPLPLPAGGVASEAERAPGTAIWPAALTGLFASETDTAATPEAPVSPPGPTEAQIAAVEAEWRDWMDESGIAEGAMAIALPDGRVIGAGLGRDPLDPAPVASLSKAITGLCLDGLLAERGLPWNSTLRDIAAEMSAAGVTPRPWNEAITLAGLVTHTAGLQPDLTQGDMVARTHGALGLHRRIASEALAETAIRGQPGHYFYSNTNYAVLGVAIEALSGRTYAETCMERVIRPAGIEAAVIEGRMGSMSSYAGREISAVDYARLARHWFTAGQPHVDTPETRPAAGTYAMGYSIEGAGAGATVSHNGRLCFDRSAREGHGATFVALGEGTAFAATWGNCIDRGLYDDLIAAITPHLR